MISATRQSLWDNIKGFLIFLVVFAHCLFDMQFFPEADWTVDMIYTFHMPAFIFISGYFGKSEKSGSFYSVSRLIFAYFIFNSIVGFMWGNPSLLTPLYSYWYLLALTAWRILTPKIAHFKNILPLMFAVSLFIGFFASVDNTLAASRIIAFYPVYLSGYFVRSETVEKIRSKFSERLTVGLSALIGAGVLSFSLKKYMNISDNAYQMMAYSKNTDVFVRILLFAAAFLAVTAIIELFPDKKIPFLTMVGRNSIAVYILHRPFTLIFNHLPLVNVWHWFIAAFAVSIIICLVFGNDRCGMLMNGFLDTGAKLMTNIGETNKKKKIYTSAVIFIVILGYIFMILADSGLFKLYENKTLDISENGTEISAESSDDVIYRTADKKQLADINKAFRISFAGDLILLEDQVKRAYDGKGYDFADMFEYSKKHISESDFAIGVFEGPMAGGNYSSGNFDDEKELYLNFPDEFGYAVKDSGFDLVTTANNHVLDMGTDGAVRTLEVLDKIGLEHTGSYRNRQEKESSRIKVIEIQGIKFAVLSYTYGSNGYFTEDFIDGELSYITSIACETKGEFFEKMKADVEKDFAQAKAYSPDIIIVLPHWGTQFSNEIDEEQKVWSEIFKENGADIILGDHPHVVEPVSIEEYNGKNVFTLYSPGNFANIYRKDQGDTSAIADIYIDRSSKKIIAGGIVPLYTQSQMNGNFRALPIYEIYTNDELKSQLSTDDYERAVSAHDIVTGVMLKENPDISGITESYLFDKDGYMRIRTTGLEIEENYKNSRFYKLISDSKTVCFVGDSVTEGTKNGGCGWYEPLEEHCNAEFLNFSKGGKTVSYFIENISDLPKAETYVIALGTNDVRYRDESICAMTAEKFAESAEKLAELIKERYPSSELVFIAPWYSTDGDPFTPLSFKEKTELNNAYSKALEDFCSKSGILFIDPNGYIKNELDHAPCSKFLLDHIHPNSSEGVKMYSKAVLVSSK